MSTDRDATRIVRSWLEEGVTALPDRVLDAVLDQLPATQQRRATWWAAWRAPIMNKLMATGLGAVAVVLAVVIGFQLFGSRAPDGPGASQSAEPSTASPSAAEPSPSAAGGLPVGSSSALWRGITVTIPASGWSVVVAKGILVKNDNLDPPDGAVMFVSTGPLYVYGDPCRWESTKPDSPATTVDELVAALSAQASRDASDPVAISVDGYAGKMITLHVPEGLAYTGGGDSPTFTDCDQGFFAKWTQPGLEWAGGPGRYHQAPGEIDEVYALDVNGVLVTLETWYYPGTLADVVDELRAMVESGTFELP